MTRLHVGCGAIFLTDDWINVDLPRDGVRLARERDDLVHDLGTVESDYYGRMSGFQLDENAGGVRPVETVCDVYGSFDRLPAGINDVDCILARQVFEHLSISEARTALIECDRVLKPGGLLRLDVPDVEGTLEQYRQTGNSFFKRHLLGSRNDQVAYHIMGWTRDGLKALCCEYCFDFMEEEPNIHPYPAFCLRFRKMGMRRAGWSFASRDAQGMPTELSVPSDWTVIEVGPGADPWQRADYYVDINQEFLDDAVSRYGGIAVLADVQDLSPLRQILGGKKADYLFCSHVMEHLDDPRGTCDELTSVAHRGMIVTPSVCVDVMFGFHESTHKWCCVPGTDGRLVMMRYSSQWTKSIASQGMNGVAHRLYRLGPARMDHDAFVARRWWHNVEPHLDCCVAWEGGIPIEVLS